MEPTLAELQARWLGVAAKVECRLNDGRHKGVGHLWRDAAHALSLMPAWLSVSPVSMASCLMVLLTLLQLLVSRLTCGTAMLPSPPGWPTGELSHFRSIGRHKLLLCAAAHSLSALPV